MNYEQRLPARRAPGFVSRELGRTIRPTDVPSLDGDDIRALLPEIEAEIMTVTAELGEYLHPAELRRAKARRQTLGAFHQLILRRRGEIKGLEQQRREAQQIDGDSLAAYFRRVAKTELDVVVYQRLGVCCA